MFTAALCLQSTIAAPASARHWLWRELPVFPSDGLSLALSEAVTNAVTHSDSHVIKITLCYCSLGVVWLEIAQYGSGFDYGGPACMPPADANHGRGLALMQVACDVSFRREGDWFICQLVASLA